MHTEKPKAYRETRELEGAWYCACKTDFKASRKMQSYIAVSTQLITKNWQIGSHGAFAMQNLIVTTQQRAWGKPLMRSDVLYMYSNETPIWQTLRLIALQITKTFSNYSSIPCFGHDLDFAGHKGLKVCVVNTSWWCRIDVHDCCHIVSISIGSFKKKSAFIYIFAPKIHSFSWN